MSNKKYVTYEEFGAVGDGKTEDFEAIKKAHDYANKEGLPVKAREGATYYIHNTIIDGRVGIAEIKTNVTWTGAKFIIDDTDISPVKGDPNSEGAGDPIFLALSYYEKLVINDADFLSEVAKQNIGPGTKQIDLGLGYPAMIIPYYNEMSKRVYRRLGYGGFGGSGRHEVIVIDKDGNVSEETPIMWDYPKFDYIEVIRDDIPELLIEGGEFTTLASQVNVLRDIGNGMTDEMGGYINRCVKVMRSHTTVRGLKHYVKNEIPLSEQIKDGEYVKVGTTYNGFFNAVNANHVTFEDCVMTGRRCYGRPKNCKTGGTGGTYDFASAMVNKMVLRGCRQTNFWIKYDENLNITPCEEGDEGAVPSIMIKEIQGLSVKVIWGIGGTNFCKNVEYIDSKLSRFDAHCGLYNGKIINSSVNVIALTGVGDFIIENTKWFSADPCYTFNALIHLRGDYGSTWNGNIRYKNLKAYYFNNQNVSMFLHGYSNWFFGYDCHVPNIEIDGIEVFDIETRKPLPSGSLIRIMGPSLLREPAMHMPTTKNQEAIYPYVDLDGDGIVDGTNVPYDKEYVQRSNDYQRGLRFGSYKNVNVITPPSIVKVTGIRGDFKVAVPKMHLVEGTDGGFFAKTKFYKNDTDYVVGTENEDNESFVFADFSEFENMR